MRILEYPADEQMPDSPLVRVLIETHAHKNRPSRCLPAWGLTDGDTFVTLWTEHDEVWDEVGRTSANITLTPGEIGSVREVDAPTEAEVAFARFRLTGTVEVPTNDFVKGA